MYLFFWSVPCSRASMPPNWRSVYLNAFNLHLHTTGEDWNLYSWNFFFDEKLISTWPVQVSWWLNQLDSWRAPMMSRITSSLWKMNRIKCNSRELQLIHQTTSSSTLISGNKEQGREELWGGEMDRRATQWDCCSWKPQQPKGLNTLFYSDVSNAPNFTNTPFQCNLHCLFVEW